MDTLKVTKSKEDEKKDYLRLIAAQNESTRRIRIQGIRDTIDDEQRRRRGCAIVAAVAFSGLAFATHFSGIDATAALQTEIQAINSFEALKEYLATITPGMYTTMLLTAGAFTRFLRHNRNLNRARRDLANMEGNKPEDLQDEVQSQAKSL